MKSTESHTSVNPTSHWSQFNERGSALGLYLLTFVLRYFGRPLLALVLHPVLFYFLLTGSQARRSSLEYLQRVKDRLPEGATFKVNWLTSYRHFLAFAWAVVDKVDAWTGRLNHHSVDVANPAVLKAAFENPNGALFITAHIGNADASRAVHESDGSPYYEYANAQQHVINVLSHTTHAQHFNRLLGKFSSRFHSNNYQIRDIGPDTAMDLRDKLERGQWLFIHGDRTPAGSKERVSTIDFLGAPADWAQGPFLLAHILECPVYLFFCVKIGHRHRLYVEPFADQITLPRKERQAKLQTYQAQYVARLERLCLEAPLQWFNFFPFWKASAKKAEQ